MNNNKLIELAKLSGFFVNEQGSITASSFQYESISNNNLSDRLNKLIDLILAHQSDSDAIAWQRYAPNLNRWIDVLPDDIKHYKNMGQKIRELYTSPSPPINNNIELSDIIGKLKNNVNERKNFESWYEADAMPLESNWFDIDKNSEYINENTSYYWEIWQAVKKASEVKL